MVLILYNRGAFEAGGNAWKDDLHTLTLKERSKLFRKIYKASLKFGVEFEDLKIFYKLAHKHGSFWRIEACKVSFCLQTIPLHHRALY